MKSKKQFRNFLIFWGSQAVSQLGSAMTGYALILWAYQKTGSAFSVSLMAFCSFMPYVVMSIFAGSFIDRHKKKAVIAVSDSVAALCSAALLVLFRSGMTALWHIYALNLIVGFMNSFQSPAVSVATGIMVPKDRYAKASGLDSFSSNLVTVGAPVLAAALLSVFGITGVIIVDLASFAFAFVFLIFFVEIKEEKVPFPAEKEPYFSGFREGVGFLKAHLDLLYIMLVMALVNFLSRLTYENILPAMLLARSGGDNLVFGIVSAVLGVGGIIGGILVSSLKLPKDNIPLIFLPAAFSFLFGDVLMGIGRNIFIWCAAGLAASIPIPFIDAGQRVLLYDMVPGGMQGRVFAVRNAVQFSLIPAGILLGGALADFVFEPFMASGSAFSAALSRLVGSGAGSGMAVMFLCTGTLGFTASLLGFRNREIRKLRTTAPEPAAQSLDVRTR